MSQHFCEYDAHTKAVSLEEIEAEIDARYKEETND